VSRSTADVCRCGHQRAAHEHYRAGSDCSLCPPGRCSGYVRRGGLQDVITRPFAHRFQR